jgi:hypothetical protein
MRCLLRASPTIASSRDAILSSIQSAPHCPQTVAGTSLTTTIPKPKSTANVVVPARLVPPHRGHLPCKALVFMMSPCPMIILKMIRIGLIHSYNITKFTFDIKCCHHMKRCTAVVYQKQGTRVWCIIRVVFNYFTHYQDFLYYVPRELVQ